MSDIYNVAGVLKIMRRIIPETLIRKIIGICPCYMVSRIYWHGKSRGLVLSTPLLPNELFGDTRTITKNVDKILKFISKISGRTVYVGLAAWWPIVTNGGKVFESRARHDKLKSTNIIVTNGHTASVWSIYNTLLKIVSITGMKMYEMDVLIIGTGNMGRTVAELLNGAVHQITLLDRNNTLAMRVANTLSLQTNKSIIRNNEMVPGDTSKIIRLISENQFVVCTTSSTGYIINDNSLLHSSIIIDDSRPEAFPRIVDVNAGVAVLEGGLINIPGIRLERDFGFGNEEDVFGCLAEAFILALDSNSNLRPSIGQMVSIDNLNHVDQFCSSNKISVGRFKCGPRLVTDSEIRSIFIKRVRHVMPINST